MPIAAPTPVPSPVVVVADSLWSGWLGSAAGAVIAGVASLLIALLVLRRTLQADRARAIEQERFAAWADLVRSMRELYYFPVDSDKVTAIEQRVFADLVRWRMYLDTGDVEVADLVQEIWSRRIRELVREELTNAYESNLERQENERVRLGRSLIAQLLILGLQEHGEAWHRGVNRSGALAWLRIAADGEPPRLPGGGREALGIG